MQQDSGMMLQSNTRTPVGARLGELAVVQLDGLLLCLLDLPLVSCFLIRDALRVKPSTTPKISTCCQILICFTQVKG